MNRKGASALMRATRRTALGTIGSGNVFADLSLPDPETELTKAKVVIEIDETIEKRRLSQAWAARAMGISQGVLIQLLRGHTEP